MTGTKETNIQEIKKLVCHIGVGVSDPEGERLYHLAKNISTGSAIVEIGSWMGKSTIWLAKGIEAGSSSMVYAIDPHKGTIDHQKRAEPSTESIFRENIKRAGVENSIIPLIMKSEEAINSWQQPIGLLFIDGLHTFKEVKKDFQLYEPFLETGGIVVFHDSFEKGVRRVIRQYVIKSGKFKDIRIVGLLTSAIKSEDIQVKDKIGKLKYLLLSYGMEVVDFLPRLGLFRTIRRFIFKVGLKISESL